MFRLSHSLLRPIRYTEQHIAYACSLRIYTYARRHRALNSSSTQGIIEFLLESPLNIWGGTLAWSLPRASCAAPVSISRMTRPQKENEFFRQWKRRPSVHPSGPVSSLASRGNCPRRDFSCAHLSHSLAGALPFFHSLAMCAQGRVGARGPGPPCGRARARRGPRRLPSKSSCRAARAYRRDGSRRCARVRARARAT
jgi:hypothetical protein